MLISYAEKGFLTRRLIIIPYRCYEQTWNIVNLKICMSPTWNSKLVVNLKIDYSNCIYWALAPTNSVIPAALANPNLGGTYQL